MIVTEGATIGTRGTSSAPSPKELLQSLLDERACASVVQRYGTLADGDDVDSFVDLFTPDAVWQRADGNVYCGHEQIRTVFAGRSAGGFSCHLICNVMVSLSGNKATAQSAAVVLKSSVAGKPCTITPAVAMASYVDSLIRCYDGRWRIAKRYSSLLLQLPAD